MKRTIKHEASDRHMTLGELRLFLAAVDGTPDEAKIKVRIAFGGWVRSIEVVDEPRSPSTT